MLNSLWPLPTVGALKPHLLLRQESFSPWAATCLPPWVFPFSAFPFPQFSLQLHVLFKAKTWALVRELLLSLKTEWAGGVTFCSRRARSGNSTQNLNRSFQRLLLCFPGAEHSPKNRTKGSQGLGWHSFNFPAHSAERTLADLGALTHPLKYTTTIPTGKVLPHQSSGIS